MWRTGGNGLDAKPIQYYIVSRDICWSHTIYKNSFFSLYYLWLQHEINQLCVVPRGAHASQSCNSSTYDISFCPLRAGHPVLRGRRMKCCTHRVASDLKPKFYNLTYTAWEEKDYICVCAAPLSQSEVYHPQTAKSSPLCARVCRACVPKYKWNSNQV